MILNSLWQFIKWYLFYKFKKVLYSFIFYFCKYFTKVLLKRKYISKNLYL